MLSGKLFAFGLKAFFVKMDFSKLSLGILRVFALLLCFGFLPCYAQSFRMANKTANTTTPKGADMSSVVSSDFLSLPASQKLQKLSEKPTHLPSLFAKLKSSGQFEDYIRRYQSQACGLKLLYHCQRLNDEVLSSLQDLSQQCLLFEKFQEMLSGEVINKIDSFDSENRSVLHTAMRDIFNDGALEGQLFSSEETRNAIEMAKLEWKKVKEFLAKNQSFEHLVVVGIGGSDLGPRAIYEALKAFNQKGRSLSFISNVDPDDAAAVLEGKDLYKTCVAVISKSGTTIETATNEALVRRYFESKGLDPKKHFLAVTGKGSKMDDHSRYLERFYIWDFVGGRYSVTSMVGVLPLAFSLGLDNVEQFLKGARDMDKASFEKDILKNPAMLSALLGIWNQNFLKTQSKVILPYAQSLHRFPAHIQQVTMESNGKCIRRDASRVSVQTGPVVWGEPGTNGQHSFYQLLHQGTQNSEIEFIGFAENQSDLDIDYKGSSSREKLLANLFAQGLSLAEGKADANPNKNFPGNRQSQLILAKRLDPYTMGALLAFYEHQVVFQGFVWGLNSFDQEGVQLGKVQADDCLEQIVKSRKGQSLDASPYKALIDSLNF